MMSNPRRMHPVAGFLRFLKQLKELFFPILVFFFIGNGKSGLLDTLYSIGFGIVIIGLLVIGILHWYRFTYRIEDGELRIEYGVFIRKKRYIPVERIQTIDVSSGIIQRMFGLVKLQVETAGGGIEAEAELIAIKEEEANNLRSLLSMGQKETKEKEDNRGQEKAYHLTPKELLILASTSGGIGIVISAIFAFLSQFAEYLPFETLFNKAESYFNISILFYVAIIVFVFFLLAWLIGILIMALRYANFTVIQRGEEIFITRGLLEKRQSTIPLGRIQAIRIAENIIRQPLGYATVYIESAGGSMDKADDFSTVLFPLVKKSEIALLLHQFVPEYTFFTTLTKAPERALQRYLLRAILPVISIILPVIYFLNPWGYFSILLLPVAFLTGYWRHRDAGFRIDGEQLIISSRLFSKTTILQSKRRIQTTDISQSVFQKNKNLSTVKTFIKSGFTGKGFQVKDIEDSDGWKIVEWYKMGKES